ncbi:MAG: lysylphosphatidylglycerol synthase transmembrane domain-containing protein, partial [Bacteroidales bacterium]
SAAELRYRSWRFWLSSFAATFISWTSRYSVVNALFLAFFAVGDHLLVFARQLVMWIMMLVSPTPGGSGFAEFIFREFLGEFIPSAGLIVVIALLWRLITYYLYLLIGAIVLPQWLKSQWAGKKPKA